MERWLSMIIAEKPASVPTLISVSQKDHKPDNTRREALILKNRLSEKMSLKFVVFRLLEDQSKLEDEFEIIKNYCSSDQSGLKRFQLGHIASVFEKYIYDRLELISKWGFRP